MNINKLKILLISIIAVLTLSACNEGPVEESAEKVDEAISDTNNALEDACEDAKSGMDLKDQDC